jgi:molybdopterin molybdotransferase
MSRYPDRPADWVSLRAALEVILPMIHMTDAETVALLDAGGRTSADDVISPIDHPPWDNSAMDGYAVRSADVGHASGGRPIQLRVIENVPAGGFPSLPVTEGTAICIMTGAPVPDGADSVIRIEHTQSEGDDVVTIINNMDMQRNIRPRGEDIRAGNVAVARGTMLRPGEIGLLATVGAAEVAVRRKPRVAILSTGDELVDLDKFDEVLAARKIVNSNSYSLAAAISAAGGEPVLLGIARDERESLLEKLRAGLDADMLVTSAGASVGEHDLVKDILEELGMRTAFWRVRVRPGSPFSFGMIGDVPVFGLPGNPVSALVTCELFVKPAIRRALGRSALYSPTVRAVVHDRVVTKGALAHFLRVRLEREAGGGWSAQLTGAQGSGLISSIAHADGLMVVPEALDAVEPDSEVDVIVLNGMDNTQTKLGFDI